MSTEEELTVLAAYHVGLFVGAASRISTSEEVPALVTSALWLLIEEAKRRQGEWLAPPKAP
jgi:hypothetical protein